MSPLAKVVPYFANPLHGGVWFFPMLKRCRFLRAPSIESFMVEFFGKLMDGTVSKNFVFRIFVLRFFSQPPKKWSIFWKSIIFHIFRSDDFSVQQTHPKNVTNRKYRSSAFQKIKNFRNRICIFENTTFLSRRKTIFPKMRGKIVNSFPLGILIFFDHFPYKMIIFLRILENLFFRRLKNALFSKIQIQFRKILIFWKAEDLYFRLVTFLGCVCWTQKSPERNMWKIVDF